MCIVWWSSGCPHCRRFCLAPLEVPLPIIPPATSKQQQQQQHHHHHHQQPQQPQPQPQPQQPQPTTNLHTSNSQQTNPPPLRAGGGGGPGTSRPQIPTNTTTPRGPSDPTSNNNNTIPYPQPTTLTQTQTQNRTLTQPRTLTQLSWIPNPFQPDPTPGACLEVERIWRCYQVDARLSVSESLREGVVGEVAWGSCAGVDSVLNQGKGEVGGAGLEGVEVGAEDGAGAGSGAGVGPGGGTGIGGGIGPVPSMDKDSTVRRVGSGSTGHSVITKPPPVSAKHLGTNIVNPYLTLNLPHVYRKQGTRPPSPTVQVTSVPQNLDEGNYFQINPHLFNPYPEVKDSELAAFGTLFDLESESESESKSESESESGSESGSRSVSPTPSPEPQILPYAFPYTQLGAKPFPGDQQQTVCGQFQTLKSHSSTESTKFSDFHTGFKSGSSIQSFTPLAIPNHTHQTPNIPKCHSKKGTGGLESFRLCPHLLHLNASHPEEQHPKEECWLTRYRWAKVIAMMRKGGSTRFAGQQQRYRQDMERQWWRLLGGYLPLALPVRVRVGDVCPLK